MFGNQVIWVTKIFLSPREKMPLEVVFLDQNVHFVYPNSIEDFTYLIDSFTAEKTYPDTENDLGE